VPDGHALAPAGTLCVAFQTNGIPVDAGALWPLSRDADVGVSGKRSRGAVILLSQQGRGTGPASGPFVNCDRITRRPALVSPWARQPGRTIACIVRAGRAWALVRVTVMPSTSVSCTALTVSSRRCFVHMRCAKGGKAQLVPRRERKGRVCAAGSFECGLPMLAHSVGGRVGRMISVLDCHNQRGRREDFSFSLLAAEYPSSDGQAPPILWLAGGKAVGQPAHGSATAVAQSPRRGPAAASSARFSIATQGRCHRPVGHATAAPWSAVRGCTRSRRRQQVVQPVQHVSTDTGHRIDCCRRSRPRDMCMSLPFWSQSRFYGGAE